MKELDPDQRCDVLIGGLDSPIYPRSAGERRYNCADCGRGAWIMPRGQQRLERWPDTKVVCHECGIKIAAADQYARCFLTSKDDLLKDLNGNTKLVDDLIAKADSLIERAIQSAKDRAKDRAKERM